MIKPWDQKLLDPITPASKGLKQRGLIMAVLDGWGHNSKRPALVFPLGLQLGDGWWKQAASGHWWQADRAIKPHSAWDRCHQSRSQGDYFRMIEHDKHLLYSNLSTRASKDLAYVSKISTNYGPKKKESSWSSGGGKVFSSKWDWLCKQIFGIPCTPMSRLKTSAFIFSCAPASYTK